MVIIETHLFRQLVDQLMDEEEFIALQHALIERPERGAVIKNSYGLRKLRWASGNTGKRGGLRVIYYWYSTAAQIYLLYVYQKSVQQNLTAQQLAVLKKLVKDWS